MILNNRILLFVVLPLIAVLMFPPSTLVNALPVIAFLVAGFILLGIVLSRGRSWALTLLIFIMGFNVIIRIMMLLSTAAPRVGEVDYPYVITSVIAIALSLWLLLRLDKADIRIRLVD